MERSKDTQAGPPGPDHEARSVIGASGWRWMSGMRTLCGGYLHHGSLGAALAKAQARRESSR